jgi:hypothetical protein
VPTYRADANAPPRTTETKSGVKTTELIVFVLIVLGVLIAAAVTDDCDDGLGFGARSAWLYVTLLSIGYMISRGLAKAGSDRRYDALAQRSTSRRDRHAQPRRIRGSLYAGTDNPNPDTVKDWKPESSR